MFIDRLRANYQAESLWRHGRVVASGVLRALKTGRSLAVLIDQDTALASAYAPFFDLHAASPRARIDLAIRQRLPIITSFIVREGKDRHHVLSEDVPYDASDPQAAEKVLAIFNRRLEDLILSHPEQWIWWHRRWRRRPNVDYEREPQKLLTRDQYIEWIIRQQKGKHAYDSRTSIDADIILITTTGCRFYYGMWRGDFSGDPSSYAQRARTSRKWRSRRGARSLPQTLRTSFEQSAKTIRRIPTSIISPLEMFFSKWAKRRKRRKAT